MARTKGILTAGLVAMLATAANRPASAQTLTVKLQVQNRANVAEAVLAQAETEVRRIYAEACVDVVWTHDAQFTVKIMTRETADRLNVKDAIMGFTPGTRTERGRVAYIVAYRVDDVARGRGIDKAVMLGAAIAHEVGHMLLFNAHSKTGVMRAEWNDADFRRLAAKQLFFTAEQGAQIRSKLATGNPVRP